MNIAVLESSHIIYEGISNILLKSGNHVKLFRIDRLNDIDSFFEKEQLDIIIINPSQIQNKVKEFTTIKKSMPDTLWTALVYTLFDQQTMSLFDKSINITDSPTSITGLITKLEDINSSNLSSAEQEQLTEREIDVLKLIVGGLSNKEIADKLFISIHTVVSHRKNISQKTGIKSQAGLTIYAISNNIIRLEDYT